MFLLFLSYRVTEFPSFQVSREGGRTNERPGTDHVISGPMRGLEKKPHPMAQTDRHPHGHGDSMTNSAQRGGVAESTLL